MLSLGLKFLFEIYGANEVSLGVFDNNAFARKCYKSVGFKENVVTLGFAGFDRDCPFK